MNKNKKKKYNRLDGRECITKNFLFDLLTEEELDLFNDCHIEVFFKKGEIIYKQGMPFTHLVIIRSGLGKIYIEGPTRKNLILRYTKTHDLNGGVGMFIDQLHHSTLMALSDCETCLIGIDAFNNVLRSNERFMASYLKEYSEKIQQTYHQFTILTQKNMESRMAESILYLKENMSANGFIEHVSKLDLSEYTGMSRESAIRVLKGFSEEGYIEFEDKKIIVTNEQSLRNLALYG